MAEKKWVTTEEVLELTGGIERRVEMVERAVKVSAGIGLIALGLALRYDWAIRLSRWGAALIGFEVEKGEPKSETVIEGVRVAATTQWGDEPGRTP